MEHPQYGLAVIEAELAMANPVFVEIHFSGQNRAYLVVLCRGSL